MKLKTPYKTVMFYGNVLHINAHANWIAVNSTGAMRAFKEQPHAGYHGWDAEHGEIWTLDARMKLEDEDWKDTLTHCPHDQLWMVVVVGKLYVAHSLYGDDTAHTVVSRIIDDIANDIRIQSVNWNLQYTFNAFMTHATPLHLRVSPVIELLCDKLFLKPKEPESRIVKDYYGMDVIVPGWARWVAMNCNGSVMAFGTKPDITPWDVWGCAVQDKQGKMVQVAWRDETTSDENWRDSLREVRL